MGRVNQLRQNRRSSITLEAHLTGETREALDSQQWAVTLETTAGFIATRYHPANGHAAATEGVVWVGGAGGGLDGPARGLYPAMCIQLQERGISGLRLHYRFLNDLPECVLDTLLGVAFLEAQGVQRTAIVGHSFGGAVVISAGALSPKVQAVVAMSTQTYGTDLAPQLAPRPLLLVHGSNDRVLPDACSRQVFAMAHEPKQLEIFPGAGHGLDECREELIDLLLGWIPSYFAEAKNVENLHP